MHPVQDIMMTVVSLMFIYSLFPQVVMNFRNKKVLISWQTIGITTIGILVVSICYLTMGMTFAGITNMSVGILWAFIGIQKLFYERA